MGSKMISKEILENRDYAKLEELTQQAMEIIKTVRR
jgi:2-dehydro-3-deoxyphosphogluconate aldolase / (4S)-4-hydroxy-2-oxoglutarate aldolase